MSPFAISICALSLVQAGLVALPGPDPTGLPSALRSRWWAIVPPASIAVVIFLIAADAHLAHALTYLALVSIPLLAAWGLASVMRGGRPALAATVVPLFAIAWVGSGSLLGEGAALVLQGSAAIALATLLGSVAPSRWLRLGIYAMAAVDAALVAADLLQGPNSVISAAMPGAGLPRLQTVFLGSASMGFGDLFCAGLLGALLASEPRAQLGGAVLAAVFGLAFNLLFFAVRELPATVPIALSLAVLELRRRHAGQALPGAVEERARPQSEAAVSVLAGGPPGAAPAGL